MNPWSYIAIFMAGVIAGLLIYIKIRRPDIVNNQSLSVGKIKSRGDGSEQNTTLELMDKIQGATEVRKPLLDKLFPGREQRKAARIERRNARREARLKPQNPP